jgi:hypothetical protein
MESDGYITQFFKIYKDKRKVISRGDAVAG